MFNLYYEAEAWQKLGLRPRLEWKLDYRAAWMRGATARFDGANMAANPYTGDPDQYEQYIAWSHGWGACHHRILDQYEKIFRKLQTSA